MSEQHSFFTKKTLQITHFVTGAILVLFGAISLKDNSLHFFSLGAGILLLLLVLWAHFTAIVRFRDGHMEMRFLPVVPKVVIPYDKFVSLFKYGERMYLIAEEKGVQKKFFIPVSFLEEKEQQLVVDRISDKLP